MTLGSHSQPISSGVSLLIQKRPRCWTQYDRWAWKSPQWIGFSKFETWTTLKLSVSSSASCGCSPRKGERVFAIFYDFHRICMFTIMAIIVGIALEFSANRFANRFKWQDRLPKRSGWLGNRVECFHVRLPIIWCCFSGSLSGNLPGNLSSN